MSVKNYVILENIFPKLERFYWKGNIVCKSLSTFISSHKNLKNLYLHGNEDQETIILLQVISNSCKELEKLALKEVQCEDLTFISALTKLRELHLHLHMCILPKDSNQFASLTHLKCLCINDKINDGYMSTIDVVNIITQLINKTWKYLNSMYVYQIDQHWYLYWTKKCFPKLLT